MRLPGHEGDAPWMLSNPIYVDLPAAGSTAPSPPIFTEGLVVGGEAWRVEKDPVSEGMTTREGGGVALSYRLRPGSAVSQFVALAATIPDRAGPFDAILIDATSAAPARVSVQLRSENGAARWGRSIYLAPQSSPHVVHLSEFLPLEQPSPPERPESARSILLVIDLVNASPGGSGQIVVHRLALGTSPTADRPAAR